MVQLPCSAYSGHITSEPLLSTVTRLCTKWTEWYNVPHTIFWKKAPTQFQLSLASFVLPDIKLWSPGFDQICCFTMCKSISRNPATSAKIWPLHDVRVWVGTLGRAYIANAADSGMGWVAVSDCHRSLTVQVLFLNTHCANGVAKTYRNTHEGWFAGWRAVMHVLLNYYLLLQYVLRIEIPFQDSSEFLRYRLLTSASQILFMIQRFRSLYLNITSWWLNQPIWKILVIVKLDPFSNCRGEQ